MRVSGSVVCRRDYTTNEQHHRAERITGVGHFHHHLNNMPIIIRKSVELLSARHSETDGMIGRLTLAVGLSYTQRKSTSAGRECSMNSSGNLLGCAVSRESRRQNHSEYVHKK